MLDRNYDLESSIRTCERCVLHELRDTKDNTGATTHIGLAVPGELGAAAASPLLAFMAEAPGAQENATGRPLVGPAGRIFDGILQDVGIRREDVLILNRVRCRPPGNKLSAYPEAVVACDHWTQEELGAYDPKVVVLMGGTAIQSVFGAQAKVGETRGTARTTGEGFEWGERTWISTYHPASLLPHRRPGNRGLVVGDVKLAMEMLEAQS